VHRLDKNTSGVIIAAKNAKTLYGLSKQIKDKAATKIYWAICWGWPKSDQGRLINFIGRDPKDRKKMAEVGPKKGREAISDYKVLRHLTDDNENYYSLIEFNIKTGRTHQIRVQSKLMGNPILGDEVYGNKISQELSRKLNIKRQLLHARYLSITIPSESKQRTFEASLPDDFKSICEKLKEISD
jgi:23S rRNA pseudouridine1911/1915/1917 synthase